MNSYHLNIITKFYNELEDPDLDIINKGMLIVHSLLGIEDIVETFYINWDSQAGSMGIIFDKGDRSSLYSTVIIILYDGINKVLLKGNNDIIYSGNKLDLVQITQFAKQYLNQ